LYGWLRFGEPAQGGIKAPNFDTFHDFDSLFIGLIAALKNLSIC
jgi:hypothetical protein